MHAGGRPRKEVQKHIKDLPDKEYFTVQEVVEFTGLHSKTIQARLRDGTLRGKKLGKSWKIYRESLVNVEVDTDLNIESEVKS